MLVYYIAVILLEIGYIDMPGVDGLYVVIKQLIGAVEVVFMPGLTQLSVKPSEPKSDSCNNKVCINANESFSNRNFITFKRDRFFGVVLNYFIYGSTHDIL